MLLLFYCFMCVGIPTHVTYNAFFLSVLILQNLVFTSWMNNIYKVRYLTDICQIQILIQNLPPCIWKYTHMFVFSHTCVVFTKHLDMSYVFGKIHTCVVKTTHMIVQVIIGNSHTCLVFTTHMEVVEISVNFHTCVVFTKQPEWDPSLNNFHSKLLSYFEQFPFLSILISFIFEFFGSLGTKTLLLHKFCFCTEIQFCFTF